MQAVRSLYYKHFWSLFWIILRYIIDTLSCAAYQMPEKLTIYSTLVGWLNAQSEAFGSDFIKHILSEIRDMIVQCRWEAARYMVRFVTGARGLI